MDLYREEIIDRYKNPRNFGEIKNARATSQVVNASCGDDIYWSMEIEKGVIKEAKFKGAGCAVSTAGADLLSDFIKGKSVNEARNLKSGDATNLLKIDLSASRVKCALMGWEAMKLAFSKYDESN